MEAEIYENEEDTHTYNIYAHTKMGSVYVLKEGEDGEGCGLWWCLITVVLPD